MPAFQLSALLLASTLLTRFSSYFLISTQRDWPREASPEGDRGRIDPSPPHGNPGGGGGRCGDMRPPGGQVERIDLSKEIDRQGTVRVSGAKFSERYGIFEKWGGAS
jgi:hypothetical protein